MLLDTHGPAKIKPSRSRLTLRWYQQESVDAALDMLFDEPDEAPLVVLPTGAGKSVWCAEVVRQYHERTGKRVLVVIHRQELVDANFKAFRKVAPDILAGIFSASLGRKDRTAIATFCNIQSVAKHAESFHNVGLVLIDECHLLPHPDADPKKKGQYMQLLEGLRAVNRSVQLLGCTATPYRTSSGNLLEPYKGRPPMFTELAYELGILDLQDDGWLCEMVAEPTKARVNSKVLKKNSFGDFTEKSMNEAANNDPLNYSIVRETVRNTENCSRVLWFAVSIDHAERLTTILRDEGENAACVHSGNDDYDVTARDLPIANFKAAKIKHLINVETLTTGFDVPECDAIIFARPTASPGLFTQMVGRGMRPVFEKGMPTGTPDERKAAMAAGPKPECLVLDYAGNISKHGTIDKIRGVFKRKEKDEKEGLKECGSCGQESPHGTKICPFCFEPFPAGGGAEAAEREQRLSDRQTADKVNTRQDEVIWGDIAVNKTTGRLEASARIHMKQGKPPSLRLDYRTSVLGQPVWASEYLCFSHGPTSFATKRAHREWRYRARTRPPQSTEEAMERIMELKLPRNIRLEQSDCGRYWNVSGVKF